MGYGKKIVRHLPKCLHCGEQIKYGRADKRFCCDECRHTHYNNQLKSSRAYRRRVLSQMMGNYQILEKLLQAEVDSIDLIDVVTMGFAPGVVTSYRRLGKHDEFGCFDIRYIMTGTRIYSISKLENVSLNLQIRTEKKY